MEPLKEMFNLRYYQLLAKTVVSVYPGFEAKIFIKQVTQGLEDFSLNQRLRNTSTTLNKFLPADFRKTLEILKSTAPLMPQGYTSLVFPDYVALYGQKDFETSMEALKYFTVFGSSEFAVREFLKSDFKKAIKIMEKWSGDSSHHVRRLSSEGSRPRLPWSFKIPDVIADPKLTASILNNLKKDPELYVRKSVANHLNDISKDNPTYMMSVVGQWNQQDAHTAWIIRHASRTLVKKGDKNSLSIFKFEKNPKVKVEKFKFEKSQIRLGEKLSFNFEIRSQKASSQKLVVDYLIHYVKASGAQSAKVFKLKELVLEPGKAVNMGRSQLIKDFTTRKHFAGNHKLEIQINGEIFYSSNFSLKI